MLRHHTGGSRRAGMEKCNACCETACLPGTSVHLKIMCIVLRM